MAALSNTKLNQGQKDFLKNFKKNNPTVQFFSYPDYACTVAIEPEFKGSKMVKVSVSYASQNERKFRAKVGQYHAADRMLIGEYIKIPSKVNSDLEYLAYDIARLA